MKKFKYWGYFGILINGLATLRGLGYILELSAAGALIGAITIAISLTGLYASFLITRKKLKGLELGRKQVWAAALSESSFILTGASSIRVAIVIGCFIFAKQMSNLLNTEEAKLYCTK